jgi:hypothetical protein
MSHLLDFHPGLKPGRIHDFGRGRPDQVHARIFQQVQVTLKVTRVFGKILVRPKLRRVDKDADGHTVTFGPGAAGKRNMPFVEVAHGRDKAQFPFQKGKGGIQFIERSSYVLPCRVSHSLRNEISSPLKLRIAAQKPKTPS